MKKLIYALILPLIIVSGLVFANRGINKEIPKKSTPTPLSAAEVKTEKEKWEATPEGMKYKNWEASSKGKKVLADAARIKSNTNIEAVITSLSLPPGSRLGFGVMARIDGVDYIVRFDLEESQLKQLQSLKVNDKLVLRSHGVSHAPKYAYPIISGESVERDGKVIYKRIPPKNGC